MKPLHIILICIAVVLVGSGNTELSEPMPKSTDMNWVISHTIPDNYYSQDCELPTDQPMYEYLANSVWVDNYCADGWDCSQMAAYMEFVLENCGYHAVIREAYTEGEQYGHSWILVEFKQGWLAYECTERYWVYPDEATAKAYGAPHWDPTMYSAGVQYDNIHDALDGYNQCGYGEAAFLKEYGWWVHP